MQWKHRRDLPKAEAKKCEASGGTKWWFIAAMAGA